MTITIETLDAAIAEAKRFRKLAKDAKQRLLAEDSMYGSIPTKETAAARRASMDLTRALAELRR